MKAYYCDNILVNIDSLNLSDFDIVSSFLSSEKEFIPTGFFNMPSDKTLIDCLTSQLSIVARFDNKIAGVRLTYLPGIANCNHGIDIGLSDAELNQVAQFHGTVIKLDMRSKGLGDYLVRTNSKQIIDNGYDYILVTVHPQNINSIKMFLRNEFSIRCLRTKYNGLPRYILSRERTNDDLKDDGEFELIELENLSLISSKLENGFVGVGITTDKKLKIRLGHAANREKKVFKKASV